MDDEETIAVDFLNLQETILDLAQEGVSFAEMDRRLRQNSPAPVTKNFFLVTALKTNAWTIDSVNAAGKPIMVIYPRKDPKKDTWMKGKPPVGLRVQYKSGSQVQILPELIVGDGGTRYYRIVVTAETRNVRGDAVPANAVIFISASDGNKL